MNMLGQLRHACAWAFLGLAAMAVSISVVGAQARAAAAQGADGIDATTTSCDDRHSPKADLFQKQNDAAMQRMMASMMTPSSGDLDQDFAAMMIAHHQGAIDMALSYLRSGSNQTLLRLAQEIIVTQQQEIAVMQRSLEVASDSNKGPLPSCMPH